MARPVKTIDYRDLTVGALREKSASLFLGIVVVLALVVSGLYFFSRYTLEWSNPTPIAKKETKGVKAPKFPTSYITQQGDTLADISKKMYGSDTYADNIKKTNNLYKSDGLDAGMTLIIPAITPQKTQGQIGEGAMTGKVTFSGDTYTVQEGETLADIAIKVYGDINAWVKIAQANNITDPNVIIEGMVLKIPKN